MRAQEQADDLPPPLNTSTIPMLPPFSLRTCQKKTRTDCVRIKYHIFRIRKQW